MSIFKINNIQIAGRSLTIKDNKIFIDGKKIDTEEKQIYVSVEGNVDKIDIGYCNELIISGEVKEIYSSAADIKCQNVKGNIETASGDVECKDITGNVSTMSGDVKCGKISGGVETLSGDITTRN